MIYRLDHAHHLPFSTENSLLRTMIFARTLSVSAGVSVGPRVYLLAIVHAQTFVKRINSNIYISKFDLVGFIVLA